MLLQTILLILLIFVAASMVGVILMQQSEGGALGMGGGPSGFMSTRGVGDLLTRTTAILAGVFFLLCIVLTVVSGRAHHGQSVVDRLKIDALSPDALQPKKPLLPPPGSVAAPALLQAPTPEVHTSPATASIQTGFAPTPAAHPGSPARCGQACDYRAVETDWRRYGSGAAPFIPGAHGPRTASGHGSGERARNPDDPAHQVLSLFNILAHRVR